MSACRAEVDMGCPKIPNGICSQIVFLHLSCGLRRSARRLSNMARHKPHCQNTADMACHIFRLRCGQGAQASASFWGIGISCIPGLEQGGGVGVQVVMHEP